MAQKKKMPAKPSEILSFISDIPVFALLPEQERQTLAGKMTTTFFTAGENIATQSQTPVHEVFIIRSGLLELMFEQEGAKTISGLLEKKDVLGGISILMNSGISVRTVVVKKDVCLYVIPADVFLDLCTRYEPFYSYFVHTFHGRMLDKSYASMFQAGQVFGFLSGHLPFTYLKDAQLKAISEEMSLVFYSKGTLLFTQEKSKVEHLYIIQKGAVERYYEENGEKTLHGMLEEGDTYGGISILVNNGISVRTAMIYEDTYFYILPKKIFLSVCEENSDFTEYFTSTFGKRMTNKSYASIINKKHETGIDNSQFFNLHVENIYHDNLLFCADSVSIQEAATLMSQRNCSSIFIKNTDGEFSGLVTDNDLRQKVVAGGHGVQQPISDIMSAPLHTIPMDAMVSEAMLEMMDTKVKHLAVTDTLGKVTGVITNSDVLSAQEQSPFFIIREIASASNIDEIINTHARLPRFIQNLINNGAKARIITKLITRISDALLDKLIQFALEKIGPAPVDFTFIILGSEGRKEQTLKTDQDNAIIFGDVDDADSTDVQAYFLKLGELVCGWLDRAGYPYCKGGIMAQNPKWCQPLSKWKSYFHSWIRVSTPQELLESAIFFDFRWAFGNVDLVDDLRLYLFNTLEGWTRFFRDMAENALGFKPPIGFFRNFVVESKGEHRDMFDIKKAMTPIVDFARIYALRHNIAETNTQERLYRLNLEKILRDEVYTELNQAYNHLMQQRLLCQINTIKKGDPPTNHINPKKISRIEQTVFRTIFKRIEEIQTKLKLDFTGGG
ncbi:MAG: cyclic nucleotide-binding domain-containing protein [Desulfobacteraceae bacterium]|nr:cyclic nucleotide-binding domain-containing protein [Desulfobacteraceae bacterium]